MCGQNINLWRAASGGNTLRLAVVILMVITRIVGHLHASAYLTQGVDLYSTLIIARPYYSDTPFQQLNSTKQP